MLNKKERINNLLLPINISKLTIRVATTLTAHTVFKRYADIHIYFIHFFFSLIE